MIEENEEKIPALEITACNNKALTTQSSSTEEEQELVSVQAAEETLTNEIPHPES